MGREVEQVLKKLARSKVRVAQDEDVRAQYASDEGDASPRMPAAVVFCEDRNAVKTLLRAASAHRVPITARGAGTNRVGSAVPVEGGIVLVMGALPTKIDIDANSLCARVSASVLNRTLQDGAEQEGLFYGPDPSSWDECQLGGNIATNAAGPRAFKYGATAAWVQQLDVISGEGEQVSLGAATRKSSSGYRLAQSIVGSEGTLAIVTDATLLLQPAPLGVTTLCVQFDDESLLGKLGTALRKSRTHPRCVEFMDRFALDVLAKHGAATSSAGMLLIETEGRAAAAEAEQLGDQLMDLGASSADLAEDAAMRELLWRPRRALSRLLRKEATHKLSEDVVVPSARTGELLACARELAERHDVRIATYGHAGDGNLHVNFLWDHPEEKPRVDRAIAQLFERTLSLGGSLSGEHGIGLSKAAYFTEEHAGALELHRRMKGIFDPKGILNPGKIFSSAHREC